MPVEPRWYWTPSVTYSSEHHFESSEEEEEEEESLFKADTVCGTVNEEDSERDRATQYQ